MAKTFILETRLSASAIVSTNTAKVISVWVFLLAATRRGNLSAKQTFSVALFYVDQSTVNKCAYNNFICSPSEFPRLIRLCAMRMYTMYIFTFLYQSRSGAPVFKVSFHNHKGHFWLRVFDCVQVQLRDTYTYSVWRDATWTTRRVMKARPSFLLLYAAFKIIPFDDGKKRVIHHAAYTFCTRVTWSEHHHNQKWRSQYTVRRKAVE